MATKKKTLRKKKTAPSRKKKTRHTKKSKASATNGGSAGLQNSEASLKKTKKPSKKKKRVRPTQHAALPKAASKTYTKHAEERPEDPYAHLDENDGAYMTVGDHLEELRKRIIAILIVVSLASIAIGIFSPYLHKILLAPFAELTKSKLIMSKAYGGLLVLMKLSVLCGVVVTLPISISILWGFVTPAVSHKTAWIGRLVVATSALLFWSGVAVAWLYIFPLSLRFLFQDTLLWGLSATHPVEAYYNFLFTLHIGSGVAFQLPLVLVILGALGIITMDWHRRFWKYIIVIIFFLAAVLTPPDPISQMVLGSALSLLYGLSVLVVYWIEKARK